MIVKKTLNWFVIMHHIRKEMAFSFLSSTFVYVAYQYINQKYLQVSFLPIGTLGTALAIFIAFRNNSAYDRWWEAQKIWWGILSWSRTWGRQITTITTVRYVEGNAIKEEITQYHKELIYRHIAWTNALRFQLREQENWNELQPFLSNREFQWLQTKQNRATQLLQKQGESTKVGNEKGYINDIRQMKLEDTLAKLSELQGECERIKQTPLPRPYQYFTQLFVYIFVLLFPLGLVGTFVQNNNIEMIIPFSLLVSLMFAVLNKVGYLHETPFANTTTDIPMTSICRTIEIDLREQLKESELPVACQSVNGYLW